MSTYDQIIDRTGAAALIPVEESREIIEMIPEQSVFLRHASRPASPLWLATLTLTLSMVTTASSKLPK